MSALGMFGRVAQGYLRSAEANRDKQAQTTKEREQFASSILLKLADDPNIRPETAQWITKNLLEIAEGKFKGKLDITQINPTPADPGQPPELGQMAAPAGQPQPQQRQMPTPPPPTGEQYLTPPRPEEQLQQKATMLENVLRNAGVPEEDIPHAVSRALTGISRPTIPKPPKPTAVGYKVTKGPGNIALGVESLGPTKEQFLVDDPNMPEEARGLLEEYQTARLEAASAKVKTDAERDARSLARAIELIEKRADVAKEKVGHKLADTARTSDKLVEKMDAMLQEIEQTGVVTGPQAMALLSWHMSMTVGGIKGARVGRDIIEKHLAARSWPQSLDALARKIMAKGREAGIIPPSQAAEWVHLARVRRTADWNEALGGIRSRDLDVTQFGIPADILGGGGIPAPPNTLTDAEALAYLEQAGGDKDKARALARADGKRF